MSAEHFARLFHEHYERLAPAHGYATREASAKPWGDVPMQNKALMIATAEQVLISMTHAHAPFEVLSTALAMVVAERNELRVHRDQLQARMSEMHNERVAMRDAQASFAKKAKEWAAGDCNLAEFEAAAHAILMINPAALAFAETMMKMEPERTK